MAEPAPASRIRFKETKDERAHRLYRAEQERHQRQSSRIHRANATDNTGREGEDAAEREDRNGDRARGQRYKRARYDDLLGPDLGQRMRRDLDRDAQNTSGGLGGGLFGTAGLGRWGGLAGMGMGGVDFGALEVEADGDLLDLHIPARHSHYAPTAPHHHHHHHHARTLNYRYTPSSTASSFTVHIGDSAPLAGTRSRRAEDEVSVVGGPVPSIGSMSDTDYTAWVRAGLDRLRAREESMVQAERAKEKVRREAKLHREREELERETRRQQRRLDKERAHARERDWREAQQRQQEGDKAEEIEVVGGDTRAAERRRYLARWLTLGGTGEIQEVHLAFGDIPWPVYRMAFDGIDLDMLDQKRVGAFMADLAGAGAGERKKALREAIRNFHPDRFYGRILPRVKDKDREMVKDGVERCSRAINGLLAGG